MGLEMDSGEHLWEAEVGVLSGPQSRATEDGEASAQPQGRPLGSEPHEGGAAGFLGAEVTIG